MSTPILLANGPKRRPSQLAETIRQTQRSSIRILHLNPLEALSQVGQPDGVDPSIVYRLDGLNGGLDLFLGSSSRTFPSLHPV